MTAACFPQQGIAHTRADRHLRPMQPSPGICRCMFTALAAVFISDAPAQRPSEAERLIKAGASDKALLLLEPQLAAQEQAHDTLALVHSLILLGRAHYDLGRLPDALQDASRAITLGEAKGAFHDVGVAYNLKANVAQENSDAAHSQQLYLQAIRYFQLAGDVAGCAIVYDNLGQFNLNVGDIRGAITWSEKAMTCLTDTTVPAQARDAALIESSLGNYYTWLGDHAQGIAHGLRSVQLAQRSGEVYTIVHTGTQLGASYLADGQVQKGLKLLLRSDSLAREHAFPLVKHRDIPELLSMAYEMLGDDANALRYYKQRAMLNDSARSIATRREIERLERRQLLVADSLHYAGELRERNAQHAAAITRQRWITASSVAVGLLVLAIALLYRDRNRHLKRANRTILEQQRQLVANEKAREAEQVRTAIARDVHDAIGSDIAKIAMLGSEARAHMQGQAEEAGARIDRIGALAQEVRRSLNDIVWAVDPARDSVVELMTHLRAHAERTLAGTTIRSTLHFEHSGADRSIGPAVRRDLFLLLKEALNNALKYAGAGSISIDFRTTDMGFLLYIQDDGSGFDEHAVARVGNGLRNMRVRSAHLGARFELQSTPGSGTSIRLEGSWPDAG